MTTTTDSLPSGEAGQSTNWLVTGESALLYIRQSGANSFANPRRLLGELSQGSLIPTFNIGGVTFELRAVDAPWREPEKRPAAPDSDSVDKWLLGIAAFGESSGASEGTLLNEPCESFQLNAGHTLTSHQPLWAVAPSPQLRFSCSFASDDPPADLLPICSGLSVTSRRTLDITLITTNDLFDWAGTVGVEQAVTRSIKHVVARFKSDLAAEGERVSTGSDRDDRLLLNAQDRVASVGTGSTAPSAVDESDAFMAAINVIANLEGIEIDPAGISGRGQSLDQRLEQLALANGFRFREVELTGRWWTEEGPPLLAWHATKAEPISVMWQRGRYRILNGQGHEIHSVDERAAEEIGSTGFMIYASLPDTVTARTLRKFTFHGASREVRVLVLTGLMTVLVGLLVPLATGAIVAVAVPDGRLTLLAQMGVLLAASAVGTAAFSAARATAAIRLSTTTDLRLQAAVWDRVLRLPPKFFSKYSTGDLAQRVLSIDMARRLLTGPVLNSLLTGAFSGLVFVLMLLYDVALAMYGLVYVALIAAVLYCLARRELRYQTEYREAQGAVTGQLIDLLTGVAKLRLLAAEERAFSNWADRFSAQQNARWMAGRIRVSQSVLTALVAPLGMVGVFLVAGLRETPIDLASFSAFAAAFGQFAAAVAAFSVALGAAIEAVPLIKRAEPILKAQPEVGSSRQAPPQLTGRIDVKNMTFAYSDDHPTVLQGIDLNVSAGEFVALVGPSGSGKSTLLRLLLGFETPSAGAIFYDDRDLATVDTRLVRRQIGTVLQSAGLVSGTIFENIAGSTAISEEAAMEAAQAAGLSDDLESFPMGLHTFISEDAGNLSGGQRQRIMIARALARRPKIVFFDEATSALDNHTQAIVSQSLEGMNATRLVIAHRLSTIRHADRIVVLEQGRIVESGKHDALIAANGSYRRLAERQVI